MSLSLSLTPAAFATESHSVRNINTIEESNNTEVQEAAYGTVTTNTADTYSAAGTTSTRRSHSITSNTSSTSTVNTSTVQATSGSFTLDQIAQAAVTIKSYIESNNKLPNNVTIGSQTISVPQFLYLLVVGVKKANTSDQSSTSLKTVNLPSAPVEQFTSGNIAKTEFVSIASKIQSYMDTYGKVPNYASTSRGKIGYESMVYMFAKVMNFYQTNKRLPNYVSISPWSSGSSSSGNSSGNSSNGSGTVFTPPAGMEQYLKPTKNCQSTDSTIVSKAQSIIAGATTPYDAAVKIFKWVQSNISYSFYYNTAKGAKTTLSSKSANCCDTAHLLVALCRAVGIPARYKHGTCTFSDGTFGHVWAEVYVNGKWYTADASTKYNSFGSVSWTLNALYGTYAELPF